MNTDDILFVMVDKMLSVSAPVQYAYIFEGCSLNSYTSKIIYYLKNKNFMIALLKR